MFTGIVVGTGKVEKITKNTKNRTAVKMIVNLGKHSKGLKIGESVALNGVCLTVTKLSKNKGSFEMIEETTKKTDLGNLKTGNIVNIERSLKAGDRLEGHFVLDFIIQSYCQRYLRHQSHLHPHQFLLGGLMVFFLLE